LLLVVFLFLIPVVPLYLPLINRFERHPLRFGPRGLVSPCFFASRTTVPVPQPFRTAIKT
jgi:hypothetical protein